MRIAMLASVPFPPREGIGFYVWNLSKHLTKQGHNVHIITRGRLNASSKEEVDGITLWRPRFFPFYPFHVHVHGHFVQNVVNNLKSEVDIFHLHSPLVPVISTAKPILLTFHSPIYENVKATRINSFYSLLMKLQAPISYRLEQENIYKASKVTAISPIVADALKGYPGCPEDIEISWNGVNSEFFTPDSAIDHKEKIILTVGRLAPGKGLEDLIQSASLIQHTGNAIQFLIIGDGPHKKVVEKLITDLKVEKCVQLLGHVSDRQELLEFYRRAKIFVLPSHHEGLPTVVLEAMSSGCPVISTRVGGIPDIISQGRNGVLVEPGNPTALRDTIMSKIFDDAFLKSISTEARRTIEEQFTWEKIGSRYETVYNNLVNINKPYG